MVQKRPFVEELSDVSSKHLRLEHGSQLVSFLELPFQDLSQDPYTSVDGKSCFAKRTTESDVKFESGKNIDFPMCTEKDIDILPGNNSNSSWPSSCNSEEDVRLEAGHISFPQEYHSPVRPRRTIVQPEDPYSYLLQRPPLKLVPVGPDFQADVPEWCGHDAKNVSMCSDFTEASTTSPQDSESNFKSSVGDELVGRCIIPMPEIVPVSCYSDEVGSGRTDCFCEDPGSVRCVRQHIREARVNLRRTVGRERFLELGFGGMGEIVAEKWSDEDEQLFHDVVYSNPASLGKNFWDRLAVVFPSRTNNEIVSYYFNVFMLRKRAEQNRCTPMDIDSDNDEWEGSEESDEDEEPYQSEIHEDDSYDHIEGVEEAVFDYHDKINYFGFKGMKNVSETWPMTLLNNSSSDSSPQPLEKTLEDERVAYDFQDDSCTTFDAVAVPQVSEGKVDDSKHWGSQEFILEPCDAKLWDAGYLTPRTKADFLPTYSMIEEVFGVEAWDHEDRDDARA